MSSRLLLPVPPKSNRTGLAVILGAIAVLSALSIYYYQLWAALMGPIPPGKDYIGLVVQAFLNNPGMMLNQTEGSGPWLRLFPIGLIWIWASYLIKRKYEEYRHITDQLFWSNFVWCLWATIFVLMTMIFNGAAQHYQWYACLTPGYCSAQPQGTMDKYTHFLSAGAIMAILVTLNIKDLLGLKGRTGRALELLLLLLAPLVLVLYWEYAELLDPARYVSQYMDSVTDMIAGMLGSVFTLLLYNLAVPFEE